MSNEPTSFRLPFKHPDALTDQGFRIMQQGILDLNQAIAQLHTNATATQNAVTNVTNRVDASTTNISYAGPPVNVNQQTADYSCQQTDFGGLIVFSGTGPYALTLNPAVTQPFYTAVLNLSSGNVVASPAVPNLVNNLTDVTVLPAQWAFFFFDGVNWWALDLQMWPITIATVAHKWLDGYSAVTGLFTASQPAFSDISGVAGVFQTTHAEPLTDGNGNFIFAATLATGGDIIVCEGIYP